MEISGSGITTFQCKTLPSYRVQTALAFQWTQLSSGNWGATDRGSGEDTYECSVSIYGLESVINNFINQIYAGRVDGDNAVALGTFFSTEHIFGENVDHSGSIAATVLEMPQRRQGSWKGFGLADVRLRATFDPSNPAYFTGTSSWPTLSYCEPGAGMDADYTIMKSDTHNGTMAYHDHRSDSGLFDGVFILSNADFIKARNYIKTQRTGNFTLADTFGVSYPFGPRAASSYPFTCKLIEWEDLGFFGLGHHRLRLKFAEAV